MGWTIRFILVFEQDIGLGKECPHELVVCFPMAESWWLDPIGRSVLIRQRSGRVCRVRGIPVGRLKRRGRMIEDALRH